MDGEKTNLLTEYGLRAEQLQRYFEERTDDDIEELEEILNAWHERNFPLLEDTSATFYAYGWSLLESGNLETREIGREVYYPANSSATSSLKITTNDLFGDDKTAIEDNIVPISDKTVVVPLPIEDLRVKIDEGIEEHIANTIRKLVSDLRREYLHWKQSPPTTDIVVQTVRNTNDSMPWDALPGETRPKTVFRDALLQNIQRKSKLTVQSQSIIERLVAQNNTKIILDELNEDVLMELRASSNHAFALPFQIDKESFRKWERRMSDSGGYEYDARMEELIIKTLPSPLHEGVVEVFNKWLVRLSDSGDLKQQGELKLRSNQRLFSPPLISRDSNH
jgi:hypothetical protein